MIKFSLQNINNAFFLGSHNLFSQLGDGFLEFDDSIDVSTQILHFDSVYLNDFSTDYLDLVVRFLSDLINEVSDGQFGTFAQNILNMSTFDEVHAFDASKDTVLFLSGCETSGVILTCLLEE